MYKLLVVVVSCGITVFAKLPPYIHKCSLKDPNINSCVLNSARQAIPHLMKGDRKLNVPVLDPLFLPEMRVDNKGIQASIINTTTAGWKSINLGKMDYDFEKKEATLEATVPNLNISGIYRVSGKLVSLPITGSGHFTASFYNLTIHYKTTYELQKLDDGEEYMIFRDYDCDIIPQELVCHLENLFNGNKLLGEAMNNFLNKNWRLVYSEAGKEVSLALGHFMFSLLKETAKTVPFTEIFNDVE